MSTTARSPGVADAPDVDARAATPLALARYFLWLGVTGFGGPIALVAAMQRDLVEARGWFSDREYREGLAFAQLAPGPLAAQLAIYLGWLRGGVAGATLAGVAFVAPSFVIVLALGWAYVRYDGLPWMRHAFYGVGAAVIGIVARGAWALTRKTLGRDAILWSIWLVLAVTTAVTAREPIALVVLGGVLAWGARRLRARSAGAGVRTFEAAGGLLLLQLFGFFTSAGAFVFGSGLAIVPFLYGGVVVDHRWLSERQFLDAVAVAMLTPGPVVITTAFIGYLVAGLGGAVVAAAGTFVPCYLITIGLAPAFRRYGTRPAVTAAVEGVTAGAAGAIVGAVVVLAGRAVVDVPTAGLAALALAVGMQRRVKVPEPVVIAVAAAVGIALGA